MSGTNLDSSKIKKAIQVGIPISITTYTLPHEMELYMAEVLTSFMKELNQENMIEYLIYCLNELVTNAKKANTKRVYFKEKGLDIHNQEDYAIGMKNFKAETLDNIKHYLQLQKQQGYYIKLIFQTRNNKVKMEIRNNAELTIFEYKRIHDKIARAQQYSSIDDAFSQILDETEGAGLGLIIMILMLQKIGLTDDSFQVSCENGETITRIILPLNQSSQNDISVLSKELIGLIDALPQFPENITKINQLLNNSESKLSDIAVYISNDVGLTADLLRLVNSAAFSLSNPCRSIAEAVKMVGTRGIKNLLYSLGSIKSLGDTTEEQKELWTHSYQVAFYTYNLGRNFCSSKRDVIEDCYVCGLLHDMGKVIFESAHPQLIERFKKICENKAITQQVFEKLAAGVNHAEIGALIAEKWNFPQVIIDAVRNHHTPDLAPESVKTTTSLVYLANMISHYQDGSIEFYQFDSSVLSSFGINTEEQLKQISNKLQKAFESER